MFQKPVISVITPAYNRGKLLKRCYDSLEKQTNKQFEWIVIDDGSTDNTIEIMNEIIASNPSFHIQFEAKKNGGKHTALNAAYKYLQGQYSLILDSDDWLTDDAIETAINGWAIFEQVQEVGIVIFLKKNAQNDICAWGECENTPVDILNHRRIRNTSNDCCEVIRTHLLKKNIFPVYENEKFLAETALWYRVGVDYKCVYINKAIYVCEYLDGGLTSSGRSMRVKNPRGGMYTSLLRMNRRCSLKDRVKAGILYVCYGRYANFKTREIFGRSGEHKALTLLCMVPGSIMYLLWKYRY